VTHTAGASYTHNHGLVRILFLGQCLQYGYDTVDKSDTFQALAEPALRTRFPDLRIKFDLKHLYHPVGLKPLLKHRLAVSQPDIVVLNLPAAFATSFIRVNLIYEIAPEIVDTARDFLQRIDSAILRRQSRKASTPLDRFFKLRPPISLEEYDRLVNEAIELVTSTSTSRVVLMAPGKFNDDSTDNYHLPSPEIWSRVNQMVVDLGNRHRVPVVCTRDLLADYGGKVFLPNNHRWSRYGHEVIAREVEYVLSNEIGALCLPDLAELKRRS
jgi:hypothetical protein